MSHIFEVKDKTGRIIYLSQERWSHIQRHKKRSSNNEEIQETLIHPLTIKETSQIKNGKTYYRYFKERKEYLLVIVRYLNGKGFVITSYFSKKMQ